MLNLEKIKNALNKQAAAPQKKFSTTKYFKPEIKKYNLRFLPYESPEGEPTQEVLFYNDLTEKRLVAPFQFGLADPIRDLFDEKRKEKDGWSIAKHLKPKKRFFAIVIDRDDEEAGPQIWEMAEDLKDSLFSTLVSADYVDEIQTIFTPDKGYDWELNVTQQLDANGKPRFFNKFPVKKFNLTIRKKPSVLHKDPEVVKKWLADMPNLLEMHKRMCKSAEELVEVLEDFCARLESGEIGNKVQEGETKPVAQVSTKASNAKAPAPSAPVTSSSSDDLTETEIDNAFNDI